MNRTSILAGMFSTVLLVSPATSSARSFKQGIGRTLSLARISIAGVVVPSLVLKTMMEFIREPNVRSLPAPVKFILVTFPTVASSFMSKVLLDEITFSNERPGEEEVTFYACLVSALITAHEMST